MTDVRNTGANIIAALRTPVATLVVLVAALLAQLPHAADVFRLVVHGDGWWQIAHSYSYAIALELAVLLFVVAIGATPRFGRLSDLALGAGLALATRGLVEAETE